jgi:gamma-glutamyl:cysteine ligase YbdK (ATP-grasp superfamily)
MAYHLFEVFGIELEYMVVHKNQLNIAPVVDQLMVLKNGQLVSDINNGAIEWSNELVAHVVELKTNGPANSLNGLSDKFHENVVEINQILDIIDCTLLPTASHPLMDPKKEMKLWQHSYSEVYALYNRIFNCSGHGWANVQSMHINLPFFDDSEFGKLHAAVRLLLPIIPGLSASSPIFEGKFTGFWDSRLEVYKTNQKEIPQMTGKVIPEPVFSKSDYYKTIFDPINQAITPFDTEQILDHHFLNSRGAIARFDRNAIEIRVIDLQECPKADLAIAALIVAVLKLWVSEKVVDLDFQKSFKEEELFEILNEVIRNGEGAQVTHPLYLHLFGLNTPTFVGQLWKVLYQQSIDYIDEEHRATLAFILNEGTLSSRILKAIGNSFSERNIMKVYKQLAACLQENRLFRL